MSDSEAQATPSHIPAEERPRDLHEGGITGGGHAHDAHGHHDPHLAHHFRSMTQQFTSAKLGMWMFLATEILMFGGLFCAYAIYRNLRPDVFLYAHHFLDTNMGAFNTVVLLFSSLTMAWAVRASMLGQKTLLMAMLAITIGCGGIFMVVKYEEYSAKWKHGVFVSEYNMFHPMSNKAPEERERLLQDHESHLGSHGEEEGLHVDAVHEEGAHAEGVAGDAAHVEPIAEPRDVGGATDEGTPHSGVMDPESFAPTDDQFDEPIEAPAPVPHTVNAAVAPDATEQAGGVVASTIAQPGEIAAGGISLPAPEHSDTPLTYEDLSPPDQQRLHIFFQIYFLMTGLHGLHVIIGLGLIGWLLVKTARGSYVDGYFVPVEIVGLYWHLVDLIWIFLFPLLYLIH